MNIDDSLTDGQTDRISHPFTHLHVFTWPSSHWTSWSTFPSVRPSCPYSIWNMDTGYTHRISSGSTHILNSNSKRIFKPIVRIQCELPVFVNQSSSYIATLLSRLLMSLSKGFFAWAAMRQPWALSYSLSSRYAWQRWHQSVQWGNCYLEREQSAAELSCGDSSLDRKTVADYLW